MPSTATVTSKTGPGQTVTVLVINNVREANFALALKSILVVTNDLGIKEFDINATTTITFTIAVGVGTLTVSQ